MAYIFEVGKMIFVMGIIVFAGYYALKKLNSSKSRRISANKMIQLVDTMPLGYKDELNLIKVGEEYILHSNSSGQMIALKEKVIKERQEEFGNYFENEEESKNKWEELTTKMMEKVGKK